MDLIQLLDSVELFDGLSEDELAQLGQIAREETYPKGEVIF